MSLSNLFKKASEIFSGSNNQDSRHNLYQDGETIFCKNNVCVHPASILREDYDLVHHPGYLTINYRSTRSVPGLHLVYDHSDAQCDSPPVDRRPRCLSHRRDSLESQCSGCSPSVDNVSLGSLDSTNDTPVSLDSTESQNVTVISVGSVESETADTTGETAFGEGSLNGTINSKNSEGTKCTTVLAPDGIAKAVELNGVTALESNVTPSDQSNNAISQVTKSPNNTITANNGANQISALPVDQTIHQSKQHQTGPHVHSDQPGQPHGNNEASTKQTQHISSSSTKCQAEMPSKESSSESNVETKTNVENAKTNVNNVITNTENIQTHENLQTNVENTKTSIENAKTHVENNKTHEEIRRPNHGNSSKSNDAFVDSKSSSETPQASISKGTSETKNQVDKDERVTKDIEENLNSTTKPNKTSNDLNTNTNSNPYDISNQKTININKDQTVPIEDDTEELEIFNIQTVRQISRNNVHSDSHSVNNSIDGSRSNVNSSFSSDRNNNGKFVPNGANALRGKNYPRETVVNGGHRFNFPPGSPLLHNQSLPCSPSMSRNKKSCKKFSIDLNEMKSLRLFFCQFVIASRESQYKILHFHHGGLNKLAKLLNEWNFVKSRSQPGEVLPYEHFMVYQPTVPETELHPDEDSFPDHIDLLSFFNPQGQIEDEFSFRKYIFFNGVTPGLRSVVWPFLLNYYGYGTTAGEREEIVREKRRQYEEIRRKREGLVDEKKEEFLRCVESVVEKDVIRTDRGNPFYAGDANPHVDTMKNILLNYAVYDAGLGYTQGMSDLLAPVLAEIRNEPDVFWCFTGLLRRGLFVCTPTDSDMEQNLNYFRELIRIMEPKFYEHLTKHVDAMELLFCHRWILLCFKREFQTEAALSIWESCWSSYATEYFHLFVCLAIVSVYGNDVVAQNLRTDEMLLHFSSLANYMDAKLILRKARGLVHNFRQLSVIPCTLVRLCQQCGPGIWDSSPVPTVVCQNDSSCDCSYRNTE
ncbi:hypothetical protein M8J76_009927 [Diaphorina citri]|nr:hypothetical protein M8J76_009927 [Diaphorina citri]